jgi:FkbM family methyltransferase
VIAVEPFPPNRESLEQGLSEIRHPNVDILSFAVADVPGTVEFVVPPSRFSSGEGYLRGPEDANRDVVDVECVTLDALEGTIGAASLVVIDTEGAEVVILRGGRTFLRRHRPVVIVEASPKQLGRNGSTMDDLHQELVDLGYAIRRVTRLGLQDIDTLSFAGYQNWVCLQDPADFGRIARSIRRCGLVPCVGMVNPLSRPSQLEREA